MERAEREETKGMKRKPTTIGKHKQGDSAREDPEREEVVALKRRITRLEAENRQLRNQIAVLADSLNRPSQSPSDSVRAQRHNFLKYSKVRRH